MNLGDFGETFYFGTGFSGAGFDMTSYTGLVLTFTAPDNTTTFEVEYPDVTLGGSDQVVRGGTFAANQYVIYKFVEGNITQAGKWTARLTYLQSSASPPISFTSGKGSFVVGP